MARLHKGGVPTYRRFKPRDLAVVTIDGRDYYFGKYGTPASKQKYASLLRSWQQRLEDKVSMGAFKTSHLWALQNQPV